MNSINKLLFLTFVLLFAFLFVPKADASVQTLTIDCSSGCVKSGSDSLFSLANDGYWYPGRILTKIIKLKNSSSHIQEMNIRAIRTSSVSDLEDVMSIEILNTKTGTRTWIGKLHDFYSQNKINMGDLNPGDSINYNFKASMNINAGNEYQGLESVFNLTLGFKPEETEGLSTISGFKYFDKNRNNKWDGWHNGEYKINGWIIYIDKNNNKKFDRGERSDTTKGVSVFPLGNYHFDKLKAGKYSICEIQLLGWESSLANHATCQQVIISSGINNPEVNFGNYIALKKRK